MTDPAQSTTEFHKTSSTVEESASEVTATNKPGARWKWFARLGLGLAVLSYLVWRGDTTSLQRALQAVPPWVLLGSVACYLSGQVLSAWKWQLLLRARGANLSLAQCCRFYLQGMFWNLWMPTNIGGDAVRAYAVRDECAGLAPAAASVLVERLTGFFALLLLAIGGLCYQETLGVSVVETRQATVSVIAVILMFALVTLAVSRKKRRAAAPGAAPSTSASQPGKLRRKITAIKDALGFYVAPQRRTVLATSILLSLLFQASQVLLNIGLARVVGLDLPAVVFWWLVPALSLSSLLPVGIGGLGVREAAAMVFLHKFTTVSGNV
ncbi:MAG TPA: lysylphosphatidylglycerol synthase transmembrane domain-containing protein, partial [Abditibacteriaceae bacterium]